MGPKSVFPGTSVQLETLATGPLKAVIQPKTFTME